MPCPPVGAVDVKGAGVEPPHIICEALITGAVKVASTVTVAVTVIIHPLVAVAFIVKVTIVEVALVLLKVPIIGPLPLRPRVEVMPAGLSRVQLVIVPVGRPLIMIGTIAIPLHTGCVKGETVTLGFTVMVTFIGVPGHPFADGVIVYIAVPDAEPVAVKVWAMLEPLDAVAPDTPD